MTIYPSAALGTLPPSQLLSSVALVAGSQAASSYSIPLPSVTAPARPPQVGNTSNRSGLILSPAAEPFPHKLVDKVKSGQFVEMRELLADNIALVQQLEDIQGFPLHAVGATRPRLRDVSSISTWCYCFLGYVAVLTPDPATRDQLAYARLIIREALRHGGQGWLDYDRAFRQQVAADPSMRWNTLLPGLQAATILGRGGGQGLAFCTLCRGSDHTRSQCALLYLQPPASRATAITSVTTPRRRLDNICMSWNRGACIFPNNCSYRHVCATCQLPHKAKDCTRTSEGSTFKQQRAPTH